MGCGADRSGRLTQPPGRFFPEWLRRSTTLACRPAGGRSRSRRARVYFPLRSRLLDALEAGSITVEQLLTSSDDELLLLERVGVVAIDDLEQEPLGD